MQNVSIIGNTGKDPNVHTFPDGSKIANFNVGVTERGREYTDKSGQKVTIPESTEWFTCVVRGGLAKVVEDYVKKGTKVYVQGKMKTRQYTDQSGQTRYQTELIADTLELLSPKPQQQQPQVYPQGAPTGQQPQRPPQPNYNQAPPQQGYQQPNYQQGYPPNYPPQGGYQQPPQNFPPPAEEEHMPF